VVVLASETVLYGASGLIYLGERMAVATPLAVYGRFSVDSLGAPVAGRETYTSGAILRLSHAHDTCIACRPIGRRHWLHDGLCCGAREFYREGREV